MKIYEAYMSPSSQNFVKYTLISKYKSIVFLYKKRNKVLLYANVNYANLK